MYHLIRYNVFFVRYDEGRVEYQESWAVSTEDMLALKRDNMSVQISLFFSIHVYLLTLC